MRRIRVPRIFILSRISHTICIVPSFGVISRSRRRIHRVLAAVLIIGPVAPENELGLLHDNNRLARSALHRLPEAHLYATAGIRGLFTGTPPQIQWHERIGGSGGNHRSKILA